MAGRTITIDDIRQAGLCASGARRWFQSRGLNFADFLKNGISAERLIGTGDALAQRVVDHAEARADG